MKPRPIKYVFLENLGICNNCKKLISFTEIPTKARGPVYDCPLCHKPMLPNETWGYGIPPGGEYPHNYGRLKYIGPDGKWTRKRPAKNFTLDRFRVLVNYRGMGDKRWGKIYRPKKQPK